MMKLSDIFDVRYGNSLELNRLKRCGPEGIPFVSRKSNDNGISAYVEPIEGIDPNPAGELTVAMSGNGVLSTFIQERAYYTGFHVACLRPKIDLSKQELLYYCVCIKANRYRYSYGRQANRTLREILLPSPSEIPSWIHGIDTDRYDNADAPVSPQNMQFDTSTWRWFKLGELFDIRKGKRLTRANMKPGSTPFIGSIDKNNGVSAYVGQAAIHSGNTITVNYNGSVAETFYQPVPFWASDDVNVLYPNRFELTPAIALFICTVIRLEKYRFNYGRKWHMDRMRDSMIRLPVTAQGKPDWAYMESYINTLRFSSQVQ